MCLGLPPLKSLFTPKEEEETKSFATDLEEGSLTRFDNKKSKKRNNKRRKHKNASTNETNTSSQHTHTFPITITRGDATMTHDSTTSLAAGSTGSNGTESSVYCSLAQSQAGNHTHTVSGTTDATGTTNNYAVDIQPSRIVTMMIMQVI